MKKVGPKAQALKDMRSQGLEYNKSFDKLMQTTGLQNPGFKRTLK